MRHTHTWRARAVAALAAGVAVLGVAACGSSGSGSGGGGSSNGDIVIGASVPLSGPVAGFGSFVKWGYEHAVNQVNSQGGITIDGKKHKVKLVLLDDKSDPNTVSNNVQQLISSDNAVALLGSCTPALVNPGAVVAERQRTPMVTGCDPLEAFKSVQKWTHVWDIFFDEPDLAAASYKTLAFWKSPTNHKIAIIHDNGPDGQGLGGQAWPALAKQFGYQVVQNSSFPTDATDFGSIVTQAKASGADLFFVDSSTPQAVSIRKQMASAGFNPKVLVMEKGGEPLQFAQAAGKLSNGVMVGGYWDPSFPFPGAKTLRKLYEQQTGQSWSQHIADSTAAAQVLLDAIQRAGSLDKEKINRAIGQTNKTYVVGPVHFGPDHTSKLPIVSDQWQNGQTKVVGPTAKVLTGKLLFPVPSA